MRKKENEREERRKKEIGVNCLVFGKKFVNDISNEDHKFMGGDVAKEKEWETGEKGIWTE